MTRDPGILTGVLASVVAALLLSTGTIIQALDARRVDVRHGLRMSLLGRLLRRRRWLAGTLIGYLAFPVELVALAHAPIVIVQPLHATGLILLLTAGVRVLGERLRRIDMLGVGAIIVGVVVVAWGGPAGRGRAVSFAALAAVVVGLVLLACVPYFARERSGKLPVILSAALAFTATNLAVKGFSDRLSSHQYLLAAVYLASAGVASLIAVVSQMTALQRHRAAEVVPLTFAIPVFLPVVLGLLVLRENWSTAPCGGVPFALGALLLLIGSSTVARSDAVIRITRRAGPEREGNTPPAPGSA